LIVHDVLGRVERTPRADTDDRKYPIMTNPSSSSSGNQPGKNSNQATDNNQTKSRTIKVDGMTGDVCVQKVSSALKDVEGVTTKSVTVGSVTIEADRDGYAAACTAIKDAGFKVEDSGLNQSGPGKQGQPSPSAPSRPGSEHEKRGDHRGGSTPPPIPQRAPMPAPAKAVR
jgi:copper chaperone CopZ